MPALLCVGTPLLAAAITTALVEAAVRFYGSVNPVEPLLLAVVSFNAALSVAGPAAGGTLTRGTARGRVARAVGYGIAGLCAHIIAVLLIAPLTAPRMNR